MNMLCLFWVVLLSVACSKDDGDSAKNTAAWRQASSVGADSGSAAIQITGVVGTPWSARVTDGADWCSFRINDPSASTLQGEVKAQAFDNIVDVYFAQNATASQRLATIEFTFGGKAPQTLSLIQYSSSQGGGEGAEPHFGAWAELPARIQNSNYVYVAHYAPLASKQLARNFSLCFDKTTKAALWVAYPIHVVYDGTQKRTDAWAFDPLIDDIYQANCISKSYGGDYDRGHQLPSADRVGSYEMNAQTFYMSNMTPQLNRLNQDMWAKLETKVRTYECSDTLYVVTGAHFGPNGGTTTDGKGVTVPLPTNYYKVLLRTKSGSTGKPVSQLTADDLISIGFWVDHKSYGNIQPPKSICTSVSDIEAKTGFKFFEQLSGNVATAVKNQNNPAQWGIN